MKIINEYALCFFISLMIFSPTIYSKSKGISNMSEASSGIFRGARPLDENEISTLAEKGIKNILNLQGGDTGFLLQMYEPGEKKEMIEKEKNMAESKGISFSNYPMSSLDKITPEVDRKIDEILEYLNNQKNRPVYIHCEHGQDRTGLIIALYRVKYENVTPDDAYKEWLEKGHGFGNKLLGHLDEYFLIKTKALSTAFKYLEDPTKREDLPKRDCNQ